MSGGGSNNCLPWSGRGQLAAQATMVQLSQMQSWVQGCKPNRFHHHQQQCTKTITLHASSPKRHCFHLIELLDKVWHMVHAMGCGVKAKTAAVLLGAAPSR